MQALQLGVLADTSIHLSKLRELIVECGHEVVVAEQSRNFDALISVPHLDAWIVSLDLNTDLSLHVYEQIEESGVPVVFEDFEGGHMQAADRKKRFTHKISECIGWDKDPTSTVKPLAKYVWVLAASTGGPEAVNRFLKAVTRVPDNVALVYAQHIDSSIHTSLIRMLAKHDGWQLEPISSGKHIAAKHLYLISPDAQVEVTEGHMLMPQGEPWHGPYKPSVNQIVAKVARVYGNASGVIVFSGMGDDGAKSCQYLKGSGGQVWVQSPLTCTVDSMPQSVKAIGKIDFEGSPEKLGQHFMEYFDSLAAQHAVGQ